MPKKKTAKTPKTQAPKGTKYGSKSEFVRSLPRSMPAKQVVEAGAKEGLVFSENLVYTVRAASKTPKSKPRAADAPAPKVAAPKASSVEQQLRKAIADVGLVRARAIFADVEAAFAGA